ncbi:MAG: M20 family metallopeptidase [Candidatus Omnitrophota bacterium]
MVNKKRLIRLTQKLISINSENPPGRESEIAAFVKKYLKGFGINAKIYEFKKGRPNIIAVLKGENRAKSLLISPHLDTVPAGMNWKINPFSGRIIKDKIYGLGATDCKGNLAVAIEAINSIVENKYALGCDLIFAATADEESGSELGLLPLLKRNILKPDFALILDSDEFDIVITQKGLIHLKARILGKRAHGAYPWRGVNAIDKAMEVIRELKSQKFPYRKSRYLKGPTINVGTIKGGDKVNVVADWCEFELDLRFLPGMRAESLLQRLKEVAHKHASDFKVKIEGIQQPYFISPGHPLVLSLKKALQGFKIRASIKGSEGATVMTFFQEKRIPAIAFGFGSSGCAHMSNEYARISNLYRGAIVLEEFLRSFSTRPYCTLA